MFHGDGRSFVNGHYDHAGGHPAHVVSEFLSSQQAVFLNLLHREGHGTQAAGVPTLVRNTTVMIW